MNAKKKSISDRRWKLAIRQLILPAASFFRARTPTDIVSVKSPQCTTAVLNLPAILATAPVAAGATIFTSIYSPPILAFFDFDVNVLSQFKFSLTSAGDVPIAFTAAAPPWYMSIILASDVL